jgi:hypothetical protein
MTDTSRRRFLLTGTPAALALGFMTGSGHAAPRGGLHDGADNVRLAHDYLYGPWEFARAARRGTQPRAEGEGLRFNRLTHRRTLSDHTHRVVTAPNNDTLYSSAFLDLAGGPVLLTAPDAGARYFCIALMDLFTDNFFYVGTRATGGRGGRFVIAGPGWRGRAPEGAEIVRASTNDVWLLARTLVDGPEDLAAAHALQDQIAISADHQARAIIAPPGEDGDPVTLLALGNEMLARSVPQRGHVRRARSFSAQGVGEGAIGFQSLAPDLQAHWRETAAQAPARYARLMNDAGIVDGWALPPRALGDFGADDALRAAVARTGLAALGREEAMYFSCVSDSAGAPLSGAGEYVMTLPANVPVNAFWSLTMYQAEADGRFFFVDNPIRRYSIGDRTRDLVRGADGSIAVTFSHKPPSRGGNWLPAPQGPWRASFRAYLPQMEMLSGRWTPPPLVQLV